MIMMTIKEYFDLIVDFDVRMELESRLWNRWENDEEFDIVAWAKARNIDLEAIYEPTGYTVFTHWCWDMCND